ncbi:MAG: hypothetical protein MK289_13330 [Trichodesmium sp. ALOHA_ZT_67]|uniref:hypothetical protein n=1 Tax=Trichodesmium erythraeum TaxID=1206 RepID=UPI00003C9C12|nr:hypothetical protein [Trichodesmium erythraeum GBRTRLIN201]MBS9771652.1 hypothetical protein [Trichodesmium erythraeum GBRTRLIN201]MCH2049424.1 hypothetical protein [Trichodesmium sp. ALOHA_ZT_67]MDT9340304.1 hypothetical protein [Trichodesmium erythraeum 21-75]
MPSSASLRTFSKPRNHIPQDLRTGTISSEGECQKAPTFGVFKVNLRKSCSFVPPKLS